MGVIGYMTNIVFSVMVLTTGQIRETRGLLYPFESETREVRTLDGKWNFLKSNPYDPTEGIKQKWFARSLQDVGNTIVMPVPASYNDITEDAALRDHVGTVWYDRPFFVPKTWKGDGLVWIRFGSVHYAAIVVSLLYIYIEDKDDDGDVNDDDDDNCFYCNSLFDCGWILIPIIVFTFVFIFALCSIPYLSSGSMASKWSNTKSVICPLRRRYRSSSSSARRTESPS